MKKAIHHPRHDNEANRVTSCLTLQRSKATNVTNFVYLFTGTVMDTIEIASVGFQVSQNRLDDVVNFRTRLLPLRHFRLLKTIVVGILKPRHASRARHLAIDIALDRSQPSEADLRDTIAGERSRLRETKRNEFLESWVEARRTELIQSGELLIDDSVVES